MTGRGCFLGTCVSCFAQFEDEEEEEGDGDLAEVMDSEEEDEDDEDAAARTLQGTNVDLQDGDEGGEGLSMC